MLQDGYFPKLDRITILKMYTSSTYTLKLSGNDFFQADMSLRRCKLVALP
jgi:hypothetical protein